MKYLFTPEGQQALADFMAQTPLLGFDFDGTLAPIVDVPEQAAMRPRTSSLLYKVATRFDCVVLSGRSRTDVCQRLGDIPVREVFGNHGLEPWHISESLYKQVREWAALLTAGLAGRPGVWIEDKGFSLSVHYRNCPDPRRIRKEALAVMAQLKGARILPGKCVYNVIPIGSLHKGTVFTAALSYFQYETALYLGDDQTDEDVFSSCSGSQFLGIHVGTHHRSGAAYFLRNQAEMDDFLELLSRAPAAPRKAGASGEARGGRSQPG